jgi:hypothetical protein
MRKSATHKQRSLFGPGMAWEQLPDSVRQQAIEVLTLLYLEAANFRQIGDHKDENSSIVDTTSC